jgi:hypothetical protein
MGPTHVQNHGDLELLPCFLGHDSSASTYSLLTAVLLAGAHRFCILPVFLWSTLPLLALLFPGRWGQRRCARPRNIGLLLLKIQTLLSALVNLSDHSTLLPLQHKGEVEV